MRTTFAPSSSAPADSAVTLKFSKKIRRRCRKMQIGVLKRRVFRQCHFPIRHHEVFLLRSRSDFHVANFWEHSRIRVGSISFICNVVKLTRVTCRSARPYESCKIFKGQPRWNAFRNWYTVNTNHFHITDSVKWKSKTQLGWVINPVTHNLARRIRFWRIKISGTWFYIFVLNDT